MRPTTADELADEREAAAEAGLSVDDYRARRLAELNARALEDQAAIAATRPPVIPLDPQTIELGRRKLAELAPLLNRTPNERPTLKHRCPHCLARLNLGQLDAHYRDTGGLTERPAGACPVLFEARREAHQ